MKNGVKSTIIGMSESNTIRTDAEKVPAANKNMRSKV